VAHVHLAAVYGMETWQGTPLLVMEMLDGGTLSQRIEKGPLEAPAAVELGIAVAAALEHLHRADVLHRDVKPSNIGFTREGVPKLMDFGIARAMFDMRKDLPDLAGAEGADALSLDPTTAVFPLAQRPSGSNQVVGTLGYLSPEAIDGRPADVSFDLWGLAIVLYECLLGRKIFTGDVHHVMARIRQGRVPDFSQVLPDSDPAIGELFRYALHRTLSRRPASARELRERLVELRVQLASPAPG
jgi:serine/threonine-protein kinase